MAGAVVPVLIAKARKRAVDHFEAAGAITPATATAYTPRDHRLDRRVFARMQAHGVFVETKPGHYYLDHHKLAAFKTTIRRRVGGVLAVGAALMAAVVAFG